MGMVPDWILEGLGQVKLNIKIMLVVTKGHILKV